MNKRRNKEERIKNFQRVREIYLEDKAEGKARLICEYGAMMGVKSVTNGTLAKYFNGEITSEALRDKDNECRKARVKEAEDSLKKFCDIWEENHEQWATYLNTDILLTRGAKLTDPFTHDDTLNFV